MSTKIYILTDDTDSDYSVVCGFVREEDANRARLAGFGDDVQTLVVFGEGEGPQRLTVGYHASAMLHPSGDSPPQTAALTESNCETGEPIVPFTGRPKVEVRRVQDFPGIVIINVVAATENEARQVCSDRFAQLRAEREGL